MRIALVILLMCMASPAWALTSQQLRDADDLLRQLDAKIAVLRGYVQVAEQRQAEGIPLTDQQVSDLETKFKAQITELLTLYQKIPKQ